VIGVRADGGIAGLRCARVVWLKSKGMAHGRGFGSVAACRWKTHKGGKAAGNARAIHIDVRVEWAPQVGGILLNHHTTTTTSTTRSRGVRLTCHTISDAAGQGDG
jgi:hypothetical protein